MEGDDGRAAAAAATARTRRAGQNRPASCQPDKGRGIRSAIARWGATPPAIGRRCAGSVRPEHPSAHSPRQRSSQSRRGEHRPVERGASAQRHRGRLGTIRAADHGRSLRPSPRAGFSADGAEGRQRRRSPGSSSPRSPAQARTTALRSECCRCRRRWRQGPSGSRRRREMHY